jgi:hypothetical protein
MSEIFATMAADFARMKKQRIRPFMILGFVAAIFTAIEPENDSPARMYGLLSDRQVHCIARRHSQ